MAEQIQEKLIEQEMKKAYIDYAMSVITARALPDVRDGLKPVHRRVLYTMSQLGLLHNKPYKKSANIVGNTMAKFHPHGDSSIYDTLVRMAQPWSLRYMLVNGQGNFGSVDGDSPAAMRYTEARLTKLAEELLTDIDKQTIDFVSTYDGSTKEPTVLPSKFPNLLVNGSSGIAVGMATNMPPHNLSEVTDALIALIDNKDITIDELMHFIKGPDFPTGAFIAGTSGIKRAYKTGRGKITLKAKTEFEKKKERTSIIVTEIPYQINKALLIEDIANLVTDKRLEGISDLRDESDRKGMRIVIELKQSANPEVVLNQLLKHTYLKTTFGIINVVLVNGSPHVLNLKELLHYYVQHRKDVTIRRINYELEKARARAHVLLGLLVALKNIDPVIKTIRAASDPDVAKANLIEIFKLSDPQAQAILDMRLQRLTSLESEKIKQEHDELIIKIQEYREILADEGKIYGIIKQELVGLKEIYGDARKTEIIDEFEIIDDEDLIEEEEVVVTITHSGYIKRLPIGTYKQQRRGGKGIIGTEMKEEDFVEDLFITNTHDYILFFSTEGKVYWLKAFSIPEAGRYARGTAIVNLLKLTEEEKISAMLPVKNFSEGYLIMATKKGLIKKSPVTYFSKPRKGGIAAINLRDKDELINVLYTDGTQKIILASKLGMAVRFDENNVRPMGRNATGIRGIKLKKDDEVIDMALGVDNSTLLTITENGYGKRSPVSEYRLIRRGGVGVINIKPGARNGLVISVKTVTDDDEIIFITKKGIVLRTMAKGISTIGRNTIGVRLMKLKEGDKVMSVAKIKAEEDEEILEAEE